MMPPRRWLPRTLFGRLVLVMTAGLLLAQSLGAVLHLSELRRTVGRTVSQELAQRVAAVYRAVDSQTGAERERLTKLLSTPRQQLTLEAGFNYEASTISQTGDASGERDFTYAKPRAVATWTPNAAPTPPCCANARHWPPARTTPSSASGCVSALIKPWTCWLSCKRWARRSCVACGRQASACACAARPMPARRG